MMLHIKFHNLVLAGIISVAVTQAHAGSMCCGNSDGSSNDPWNGFYVTGQVGTAWVKQSWNYTNSNFFNTAGPILLGSRFNLNARGFTGGAALGYNYQSGNSLVPGVVLSLSGTSIKPTIASPFFAIDRYSSSMSVLAALKAQLGYAYEEWLFNFNGGLAMADSSLTLTDTQTGVRASSSKQWKAGWIFGLGVDRKVAENVSIGLSYDYSDIKLNSKKTTCTLCGTGLGAGIPAVNGSAKIQTVMVRASYLFNQ